MSDGTITFSTELDNKQLEADLKKAEKDVESLKRKVEKSESDRNAIADKLTQAREEAAKTEAEIVKLAERLKELDELAETDPTGAQARAEVVTDEFVKQAKLYDSQQSQIESLEGKWATLDAQAKQYTTDLDAARQRQADLGAEYVKSMQGKGLVEGLKVVEGRMDAFASRVTKIMKKVFVFGVITKGLRELKSYLSEALAENERFQASWANLKATIEGVASYVAQGLAPALMGFINVVAAMISTLASMVDSVFKTNIADAIAHAKQAAQASDKQAKATKKLGKEAKEASRQLMSFDEINAMNADTSQDAADALGDEVEAPGLNWDAFDVGKIDEKLAEIMAIIGAALIAVGAILCFSGINIPLGITLMAIGALMVYTAYREQWDKLPQEVRDAITGMLVVAGIILLLLGVVLAFAGPATVAIGIGMMAAGAALLWTAVALNWESLSTELKTVVSGLMLFLGTMLLVIGAILVFSGGGTPLGIGLMLLGAATLAGVAALNWDSMPEEIKSTVTMIATILGGALLVIGAILALSAPATGPAAMLGVGLMLAGAVALGTAVGLNWDTMPDTIKPVIAAIASILGGALIAIGAILCLSGAALPLGIALIAAGAVSLATAALLNWEELTDNIDGAIAVILAIVGGALLAVGIILCVAGVSLPLGIAIFALGAAALAADAALNWNKMTDETKKMVSTILGIVGGALLVIGIILCVTGVGIPIGIACILAGIGSMVAAAAINWDFFKDKVREIWEGIKSYWHNNIAHIFTWSFWRDIFISIVNGLISSVNNGLNAFGEFVNAIGGGITDILNWLGVKGWSFSISMPQIPYLAEGAVIPPNRKFLAVLGDQTSGNNLEAPESLIRQIVREESGGVDAAAMQQAFAAALVQVLPLLQRPGGSDGDVIMVLQVGNEELARAVNKGNASMLERGLIDPAIVLT